MATILLIYLLGGVALLIWGLRMVRTGVMRAFGGDLRRVLGRAMSHRLRAFASGLGVTAMLQSSTATALMIASFAERGLVATAPALAVMLGADVGTAAVAQVLSFDVSGRRCCWCWRASSASRPPPARCAATSAAPWSASA